MSDLPKVNPVTIHSSFVMDVPFEEQVAKRRSSQSPEDIMEAEVARAELFKGQEMFATGDRSALGFGKDRLKRGVQGTGLGIV